MRSSNGAGWSIVFVGEDLCARAEERLLVEVFEGA